MKKRWLSLAVAAMAAVSVLTAGAEGFDKKFTYAEGTFTDVPDSEWYAAEVKSAYELGFMNGVGEGAFSPDGNVTVAEAITMASRVNASFTGKTIDGSSDPWYRIYVDYAVSNGIIPQDRFSDADYERNIKRSEMAEVFYKGVPESWFTAQNDVSVIPDVNNAAPYRDALLALYRSGVVMGNDEYGSFHPASDILRCEAAAIINRIAIPENRLTRTLAVRTAPIAPHYFIDDSGLLNPMNYGQYGWEFDLRGTPAGGVQSQMRVLDTSKTESTAMLRTFARQTSGRIVMESVFTINSAENGFFIALADGYGGKEAMRFITKDGKFNATENGKLTDTGAAVTKLVRIKTITDLDAKTNTLILDDKVIGTYALADATCTGVDTLVFGGTKEDTVIAVPTKTKLYSGYALNDIFLSAAERPLGYPWTVTGANASAKSVTSNAYDTHSAVVEVADTDAVITAEFAPITRKVCFEMKFYLPQYVEGMTFALTNGGEEVVKMVTRDQAFYTGDGVLLKKYDSRVWQTLRFEANTDNGVVDYAVDHKRFAKGNFYASSFDGVKITLPAGDYTFTFDDTFVYNLFDEEPDYVPEPVPVESPEAIIGMEVCDIWRNGFQFGWDYTSAFDELTTYLGLFDEGSPEVGDWETKWLVEHGIDFKLVCWYNGTPNAPLKTPRNNFGLVGQLNGKYTDMMKYAIMWEDAANVPPNAEAFRNYVVPYWVEYYLSDRDRYFTIDNKALITIYRMDNLINNFGGVEGVKAQTDYLREVIKGLGYDDAIILTYGGNPASNLKDMGIDGVMAYNWGQNGKNPDYQINGLTTQDQRAKEAGITAVPTVGVGFSNMYLGQGNHRSDNITNGDFETVLRWVWNDLLAQRDGERWQTDMLMLSNWNEFGEGHYIMPTNRNGFGYLDVLRNLFADEGDHEDARPDEAQKSRFTTLYNQDLKRVRFYELVEAADTVDMSSLEKIVSYDFTDDGVEHNYRNNFGNEPDSVKYGNGEFYGKSAGADFSVVNNTDFKFNAKTTRYLHLNMRVTSASSSDKVQVYFLTTDDTTWNDKKFVDATVIPDGEYHEYLIDMSTSPTWRGTITKVRIDPINRGACDWGFKLIEFLGSDPENTYDIYVNSEADPIPVYYGPNYVNGGLMAAIDPYSFGFYARLGLFYRWNAETGKFTVYGQNDSYIEYTVGSSSAKSSEGDLILCAPTELYDGIPYIDIDTLCNTLKIPLAKEPGKYVLRHPQFNVSEDGEVNPDIIWEFDVPGYLDGFTTACLNELGHENGVVTFESTSNGRRHDPVLNSQTLNLNAYKYEKVVVRMAYNLTGGYGDRTSITSTVFFHGAGGSFNADDSVSVITEGLSSDGKFIEIEFDMTQAPRWAGTITQIRFDPFEAEGTVQIDSIKIILTDPEGKIKAHRPTSVKLVAGEDLPKGISTSAVNGKLSVIDDPDGTGKKVYQVQTSASGRQWTYFNIFMNFVPGSKYHVSYRIYPLKDFNGDGYESNSIAGNFIYGTDGNTVSNHTFKTKAMSSDEGWVSVDTEVEIPGTYVPSPQDCFQFWSNPVNNAGVSYLVDDIDIQLVK